MSFESFEQVLRLPRSGFQANEGGRLMIGAYNSGINDVNLKLSVSFWGRP